MRRFMIVLLGLMALTVLKPAQGREFLRGADVSFEPQITARGGVSFNDSEAADLFAILRAHGLNTIRLRLWHTPAEDHNSLAETINLAERANAAGFRVLDAIHFSDTWAVPGDQAKPAAWSGLTTSVLSGQCEGLYA
jgi:arabinogalactan endo-1,4-beta-galactosidase